MSGPAFRFLFHYMMQVKSVTGHTEKEFLEKLFPWASSSAKINCKYGTGIHGAFEENVSCIIILLDILFLVIIHMY